MRTPHRKPPTYHRGMRAAAVVLAGGRSVRMGSAKAALPWHGSTLLRHVCGLVGRGVDGPVLVVRAPGQALPALPKSVEVLDDPTEGLGPLQGIAVGLAALQLAALQDRADVAFVCATDVPFLHPVFVRRVVRAWAESDPPCDVVLPVARGHAQPLAAAYRPALAPLAAKLVAADRLRPAFLFDECTVRRLDDDALLSDAALRAADPHLDSVVNLNGPDDYAAAHERPVPQILVECFGVLASSHGRGIRPFRAATVAGAAQAAGVPWDRHVLAALNGDQTGRDGDLALVAGDTVAFLSAAAGG
jgi:molybdenum cofactor guanylyltransferase